MEFRRAGFFQPNAENSATHRTHDDLLATNLLYGFPGFGGTKSREATTSDSRVGHCLGSAIRNVDIADQGCPPAGNGKWRRLFRLHGLTC